MAKITVAGCGVMGSALVRSFMRSGHEVTIVDLNEKASLEFVSNGATYTPSLEQALDADFIVLNVPSYGIAKSMIASCDPASLSGKVFVNLITGSPVEVDDFEKIMNSVGGHYIDGAIECYPEEVGTENGNIVYSGDKSAYEAIEPALAAISPTPIYLGENLKSAATFDTCILTIQYGFYWAFLESVGLCMKNGFPIEMYDKYMSPVVTAGMNAIFSGLMPNFGNYNGTFEDADVATVHIHSHAIKNLIETYKANNLDVSVMQSIDKLVDHTIASGLGNKNFEAVLSQINNK